MNAFEILGLKDGADKKEVHRAYRALVKTCHPDLFEDPEQRKVAQQKLLELNQAYEIAYKKAGEQPAAPSYHTVPLDQALDIAERLRLQGRYETALLQLGRAEFKDDRWFFVEGKIMLGMKQYGTAHQAFREAVRISPENREYREWALEAALQIKKHQKLPYRVADWAEKTFRFGKKNQL
ncbi:MAG: DnaJ domain-containing protein [Clostridia bacterium]|nr:DnaJ domain-containing protein [Clostridia bacterium]